MKNPAALWITVRALIVHDNKLFMVKHAPNSDYFALPGGGLENNEHITTAMERELMEELGVKADVGRCLIVNDWISPKTHYIEFFFWIRNSSDFLKADYAKSTHGFELSHASFGDPTSEDVVLLPSYLKEEFPKIAKLGEDYPTQVMRSSTEAKNTQWS